METKKQNTMMHSGPKVPIQNLEDCITCPLCKGYFIDATTIVECLHTFCRSCIVKYLEKNKYCPVCDVQVHKTKPLLNLRADTTVQNLIYKLVPRLYHDEMKRRKVYYDTHPEAKPTFFELNVEEFYQNLLTPEETLCLTLSYNGCETSARYFRCPSAVNVAHIKRLIRAKYELSEHHRVEVLYNQDCLSPDLSLMDVAYIYSWKRNAPLELTYKIYECRSKKTKLDSKEPLDNSQFIQADTSNNNNWKEVQLRISESGEISVTGIQDANLLTLLENENFKQEIIVNESSKSQSEETICSDQIKAPEKKPKTPKKPRAPSKEKKPSLKKETAQKTVQNNVSATKKELPGLKFIKKIKNDTQKPVNNSTTVTNSVTSKANNTIGSSVTDTINKVLGNSQLTLTSKTVELKTSENCTLAVSVPSTFSLGAVNTVFSTINSSKCSTKLEEPRDANTNEIKAAESHPVTRPESSLKRKNDDQTVYDLPLKIPKPTILNHSLSLISNLSNNHPLKKHSKTNRNGEHLNKSVEVVDKIVSSVSVVENCVSTAAKVAFATGDSSSKPIILNQNVGQANAGLLGKNPTITVPSYAPKSYYSPVVSVPSRSNQASNEEGKVRTNTSKMDMSQLSAISSAVPSQISVSLTNNTAPVFTQPNTITMPPHGTPPFLLNSAIGTALKHPGITTFATHLTPSTGFNHSSYMSPQPSSVQAPPQSMKPSLPTPSVPATPPPMKSALTSATPSTTAVQATPPQPVKTIVPPPPCGAASQTISKSPKSGTPLGYKTLRDPPKSWNAQIAKANLNVKTAAANQAIAAAAAGAGNSNLSPGGKYTDLKSVRPAKFFKQRNMPRYLGNPASGVKPMFPIQTSPDKGKEQKNTLAPAKAEKSEIKKHSIVKIDPKTLKPISEKAPETSNLSNISNSVSLTTVNHQHSGQEQRVPSTNLNKDLRINTSSVSIFNPLKLQQNSPKSDRKSPKSPHSPKPKSSTGSLTVTTSSNLNSTPAPSVPLSPTSVKREQKQSNLTFTPPNPFVPNMAAQALSPNQFLFPAGAPPGFPTYDPRVMAAYHSLWYSQRLAAAGFHGAFPSAAAGLAGLANLGLQSPNSASHQQPQQQHSPGVPSKHITQSKSSSQSRNSSAASNSGASKSPKKFQPNPTAKSLETALEKLTQNKVKELGVKNAKSSPSNKEMGIPYSTSAKSTILPPIVPNVDSVDETSVEKVPVSNNVAENRSKEQDSASDKQKHLERQTVTEKRDLESSVEKQTPKNRIDMEKTPKTSPENTEKTLNVSAQSRTDTDLKECNNPVQTSKKIPEESLSTSRNDNELSELPPVTFSNVLSLTNATEIANTIPTSLNESSSVSKDIEIAVPLESSVTHEVPHSKETKNFVTHAVTDVKVSKCDMSNDSDRDNVPKAVGINEIGQNNEDTSEKSIDSALKSSDITSDAIEKCGDTPKTTEIAKPDSVALGEPSKDNIKNSNSFKDKNGKISTETSQSESQSKNQQIVEDSETKKDSANSVSEKVRDTNEQSEVKGQENVVDERK